MKLVKKILWVILCILVFNVVFIVSGVTKLSTQTGIAGNSFTLQNEAVNDVRFQGEISRETIEVSYITNEGSTHTRQITLCRPADAKGDLPLIYIPHYAMEENTAEFQEYMSRGWAVASPVFQSQYNGQLVGNDLVFNNAALYKLRSMDGIDRQRIAIVGGSAGGYMALMLSELQMGTCATIANSPIANVYYNLYIYFQKCDEVNGNAGLLDIPIPIQLLVSKSFRENLKDFPDVSDASRWAALSPLGMAKCISSPIVVNHYTGDILVPVDQITKRYTHTERDESFPADFPISMADDYPGILSYSLEEEANPDEVSVQIYELVNQYIDMEMPISDKLLTINIFDDGPMMAKGSHTAPGTTGSMDTIPYLEKMFSKTLAETEKATPEKLLLLLERYQGDSVQLPAHENIDDSLYGSLAVYQKEVIEEFQQYTDNHSLKELEEAVTTAINSADHKEKMTVAWNEIKAQIK